MGRGHGADRSVAAMAAAASRLLPTYSIQVKTLRRLRTAGSQFVRVEHVHVNEGGQAIVGPVKLAQPRCSCSERCVMRCMMCGDDIVLTEAMPAEAGGVQGFETQTHHCPACHGTERRFIFVGRKTDCGDGGSKTAALARAAHPKKGKVSHHVNGADKTPVHPRLSIKLSAVPAKEKSGSDHEKG